jgi:Uma2 family endonuclease
VIELVEGEIVEMTPIGSRHAGTVARIQHVFSTRRGGRAVVWTQNPLVLVRHRSELQPDLMLLAFRADFYAGGLPAPGDVPWLIDLDARRLEIHRDPGNRGYRDVRVVAADETFSPTAFPELTLTRRDLLG